MAGRGIERRQYQRRDARIKVKIQSSGKSGVEFQAFLPSRDIGLGGVFLESGFFLPLGTELIVKFELPGVAVPAVVKGTVSREQRPSSRHGAHARSNANRTGFAIRFQEYIGGAEISLATFFLAPEIRRFLDSYRHTGRQQRITNEHERMLDLIVAWEMDRLQHGGTVAL